MAELVPISQKFGQIRDVLEKRQGDIAKAIPRGIDAQRFTRVALSNFQLKPQLLECTPASVFTSVMQAAAWGLELDPVLGQAYLIPFKNRKASPPVVECQLMLGYRGMLALARRSGDIARFLPGVVHSRDHFEYKRVGRRPDGTLGTVLDHLEYDGPDDPGDVVASYVIMFTKDGEEQIDVMFRRDIDKVRARSRSREDGPWVTDFDAMALKSVIRRASKFWPLETSVAAAINQDELQDIGVETPIMALTEGEPPAALAAPPAKTLDTIVNKPVPGTVAPVAPAAAPAEMTQAEHDARVAELKAQLEAHLASEAQKPADDDQAIDREIAEREAAEAKAAQQQATGQTGKTAEEQARERSRREQAERHEPPKAHRGAAPPKPSLPIEREPGQEG